MGLIGSLETSVSNHAEDVRIERGSKQKTWPTPDGIESASTSILTIERWTELQQPEGRLTQSIQVITVHSHCLWIP
jgi:hypothetical protein